MIMSKILFVDDEIEILNGYKRNLRNFFDINICSNPLEALEMLDNCDKYSVIVSDYRMPQMNGNEFLEKVMEKCPDPIRIMLTGQTDLRIAIDAVNNGNIFRFLEKPCPIESIKKNLYDCVEQFRLRKADEELYEMKSRFISLVTQEYRNPLTKILLSSDLLEKYNQMGDKEGFSKYLDHIRSATKDMTAMLDKVLTVGRIQDLLEQSHLTRINLVMLMKDVIGDVKYLTGNSHKFVLTAAEEELLINSDERIVRIIFNNILTNAIMYSKTTEDIKIDLKKKDQKIITSIEDKGVGIPIGDRDRIFDPFFRGSNIKHISGSGLGLTMAARCAASINANIKFDTSENIGSVFDVELLSNLK
jgi:two-component system sensor histidine kinase/response regulator